jgi:hypothetical protein
MKTGNRYGKILMCMQHGMNNKFLLGGMAAIQVPIDGDPESDTLDSL